MRDGFQQADNANRLANLIRFGRIVSFDLAATPATVRVEFEDGWVSNDLPLFQLSAGRVKSWSAPMAGEQVLVFSPSGELGAGVALRGLAFADFAEPASDELLTVLASWPDGASDLYDEDTKTRAVSIPAGGALTLDVGPLSIHVRDGGITLTAAGKPITLTGSSIVLDGPVALGGSGGAAVARVGDPVVNNKIASGSPKVTAA
ncbi:MAG: phage baseplate assembly protein V [Pseudomonadota bacterium]|jgi:phage baseplate assembly protein V|nr:phage baseplate assembly protein V [Pseudomonadota bacterium]MED5536472.1 phage baseplate assembly protein V [Pseudomonadota bacterium]